MGIVAIVSVAAGLGFLLALRRQINKIADEEGDEHVSWLLRWGARGCALLAFLGVIGLVDAYIYKLPSPFEPEQVTLPAKPKPVPEAEPPKLKDAPKPDPMKEAKAQHRQALDEFAKEATQ